MDFIISSIKVQELARIAKVSQPVISPAAEAVPEIAPPPSTTL